MGSNRKDLLRECLIKWNLEYDYSIPSYCLSFSVSTQVCTGYKNDRIEFVSLEELTEPSVRTLYGGDGLEW